MATEIKVPQMGESISEAVVGTILKPTGSKVLIDDEILELETDKVNQVLYAQQEGVVTITVKTGEVVSIGQVIGTIDLKEVEDKNLKKESEKKSSENKAPLEVKATVEKPFKTSIEPLEGARIFKENFISELANEKKEPIKPSPVEKFEKRDVSEQKETRRKMSKVRQVIAKRLVEAQHNTAMLTTFNEVDMSLIMQLRANYKDSFMKEHEVKLGFMSFFIKASVVALQEFPDINSYIEGDEIVHRNYYDIGVAVGTEKGLFVPVIRDCDRLSFAEIEKSIEEFAKKANSGKLVPQDLQGGGFTITNGGVYGSLLSTPILNPPQSGILGMHKIEKRPVVINDQVVIRPMMYLALSYDHRIVDGKEAVSFLVSIKNCLEDPSHLLLNM